MKKVFYYLRFQYKLLLALIILFLPLSWLCIYTIGLDKSSSQILLFGFLIFIRLIFGSYPPSFLQVNVKKYLKDKFKRTPSNKDISDWEKLNKEGSEAAYVLAGLLIFILHLVHSPNN